MTRLTKRTRHMQRMRALKAEKSLGTAGPVDPIEHNVHWEGLSDSDTESEIELSNAEDSITNEDDDAFKRLLKAAKTQCEPSAHTTTFPYQRGSVQSSRHLRRIGTAAEELRQEAQRHSQSIELFFSSTPAPSSSSQTTQQNRRKAIEDLEKKLKSKTNALEGQCLKRHRAVLALLYSTQSRVDGTTRQMLCKQVAATFNSGKYFGEQLVKWERGWIQDRCIPEGSQGMHAKVSSWFNDEGVQIAVREWCAGQGERKRSSTYIGRLMCSLALIRTVIRYYCLWSRKGYWRPSRVTTRHHDHPQVFGR
jgi:uncharacterized protein YciI